MMSWRMKQFKPLRQKQGKVKKGLRSTKNLSRQLKNIGRGKEEMKKHRAMNKKLVTGSLIWLILFREINYNTETS